MKHTCPSIRPGQVWLDTNGNRIHAHGGSIITVGDTFYWYGENKEKSVPGSGIWHYGVRMYKSKDLYNWEHIATPFLEAFATEPPDWSKCNVVGPLSQQNTSLADYVWLPVRFDGEMAYLDWQDEWRVEDYEDLRQ